MSYSISDLLIRNLRDVFGENDPARRRAAIDELWAEDGVFYDPSKSAIRGRDEIDRVAGTDFIISRGGRIAALYMFFDKLPRAGVCGGEAQPHGADVAILENGRRGY